MPLLDIFWTTLVFFGWVLWFMLLFRVYGDVFTRKDIGGWAKAGWVVFTLFLPFLGVFVYLISQGRSMADRSVRAMEQQQASTDAYIRSVAVDAQTQQLAQARELVQSGAITQEEFQKMVPSQLTQDGRAASSERLGAAGPA